LQLSLRFASFCLPRSNGSLCTVAPAGATTVGAASIDLVFSLALSMFPRPVYSESVSRHRPAVHVQTAKRIQLKTDAAVFRIARFRMLNRSRAMRREMINASPVALLTRRNGK